MAFLSLTACNTRNAQPTKSFSISCSQNLKGNQPRAVSAEFAARSRTIFLMNFFTQKPWLVLAPCHAAGSRAKNSHRRKPPLWQCGKLGRVYREVCFSGDNASPPSKALSATAFPEASIDRMRLISRRRQAGAVRGRCFTAIKLRIYPFALSPSTSSGEPCRSLSRACRMGVNRKIQLIGS